MMVQLRSINESNRQFLAERAPYMGSRDLADKVIAGMKVSDGVIDSLLEEAENVILPTVTRARKVTQGSTGNGGVRPSQYKELPPLEWVIKPPRKVSMQANKPKYGRRVNASSVRVRRDESVKGTGTRQSIYVRG